MSSYDIIGKAFDKNGIVLKDQVITVKLDDEEHEVKTDSLGNYKITVGWRTACPSGRSRSQRREMNSTINYKTITFSFNGYSKSVKNKWKRYGNKGIRTMNLRAH